jgi:hypothetical protein
MLHGGVHGVQAHRPCAGWPDLALRWGNRRPLGERTQPTTAESNNTASYGSRAPKIQLRRAESRGAANRLAAREAVWCGFLSCTATCSRLGVRHAPWAHVSREGCQAGTKCSAPPLPRRRRCFSGRHAQATSADGGTDGAAPGLAIFRVPPAAFGIELGWRTGHRADDVSRLGHKGVRRLPLTRCRAGGKPDGSCRSRSRLRWPAPPRVRRLTVDIGAVTYPGDGRIFVRVLAARRRTTPAWSRAARACCRICWASATAVRTPAARTVSAAARCALSARWAF